MRSVPTLAILAVVVAACVTACRSEDAPAVAVSIEPHAWLVESIAGDHFAVVTVLRPGASPATYAPADADVSRVMRCRALFRAGVPFEQGPWFGALQRSDLQIVDLRRGIELRELEAHRHEGDDHGHGHGHGADDHAGRDPHTWLAPRLLAVQAQTVVDTLVEIDPVHAAVYEERGREVIAELERLDAELSRRLEPLRGRAFFVFHPAWGYFADAYDLRQVAIETGGREPTDQELTELQRRARAENVRVIFVQPQIAGRSALAVAHAVDARLVRQDPLARDVPATLTRMADELLAAFDEGGGS